MKSGVSIATVSRVLNGNSTVAAALRERVDAAVAALGYRPNLMARNLRTQRTGSVGVIVPNIGNAYFADIVRAAQDTATAAGYTVLVMNSDGSTAQEEAAIRTLDDHQVEGLLLVSASSTVGPGLRALMTRGIAVLAADRGLRRAGVDHVLVDVRAGTREAVAHLVAHGRRRIALIGGPGDVWTAREKLKGYQEGLHAAGLTLDDTLIFDGNYTYEGGEQQARALIGLGCHVDAVIVANNLMALGAMRTLLRQGVKIPSELALVGYDDAAWMDVVQPTVSVVSQPTRLLGKEAMRLLLERIASPLTRPVTRLKLPTRLIIRESS